MLEQVDRGGGGEWGGVVEGVGGGGESRGWWMGKGGGWGGVVDCS